MKSFGIWIGTAEVNFTNRIQKVEGRISDIEDRIIEMDTSKHVKSKIFWHKTWWKLEQGDKTKYKDNRNKERTRHRSKL